MASSTETTDPRDVVATEALTWADQARALTVTTPAQYSQAAEMLKGIKALRAKIDHAYDDIIATALTAHRTAIAKKREAEAPLLEAEGIIKRGLIAFNEAEERRRQDEQRRLEREARDRAEAEAVNRAAALEVEGKLWGDGGLLHEADQVLEEAIQAPPPAIAPIQRTVPKVAGITHRVEWKCQLVSLTDLIAYVAAHPQHANLLAFNQTAGNGLARALQGGLKIPGLRAYGAQNIGASGR